MANLAPAKPRFESSGSLTSDPASPASPLTPLDIIMNGISAIGLDGRPTDVELGFEGNEKRLEIDLKPDGSTHPLPLTRQFWDELLQVVSAKILDFKATALMEGYILSESSLFVSANRVTLITCGTTVLLGCLQKLVAGIESVGREIEYLQYSRKDFTYPWQQPVEHRSIASEYSILRQCAPEGAPYILGPLDRDHYFIYVMDKITRTAREEVDMNLNVVMYGLADDVCKLFFSSTNAANDETTATVREKSGLSKLFDHCEIVQDQIWEPCGYSANAFTGTDYWTTHITPEKHCSYASFETNASYASYTPLITDVLGIFRPQRVSLMMLLDEQSPGGKRRSAGHNIGALAYPDFVTVGRNITEFGPGYCVIKTELVRRDP